MAWIESHEEILTHPKSKRLKRKLNVSIHEVVGILHFFWHWAVRYAEDGDITKFSAEDIADAIEFDGDADKLLQSLIESGFVDELDEKRVIHDWFDYGGKLILWRRKEAERLKGYRKSKKKEIVHSTNEERTMYVPSADTVRTPEYSNSNSKSNKEDIKPIVDSDECDQLFEQFWKAYPKKDGKEPAKKKWSAYYKKGQIDFVQVMNGLERYKLFIDHERNVRKFDRQYLSGSTFVNQKHWESEWKIEQPIMGVVIGYKSKAEKDAEQVSALKQRILGGAHYEDVNAARSRIDITPDQNGIPQLQFDR